ncbi:MAG: LegC family aminotransferase [Chthonomonadales bacterium]
MSTTFEPGAPAAQGTIPLSVPHVAGNEWKYIKDCLDTGWVSSVGSYVDRFEGQVADYVGAKYAVAVCNGTAALHIGLLLAGVEPDEEVILPSLTFIASANAVRYTGAWPTFIDVEPDYWQMDPERLETFLTKDCHMSGGRLTNRHTSRTVSAIMPVHILGHPVDLTPIRMIAAKFGLQVVEDAAEALGAKYYDAFVGNTESIACFSFNGNKLITTGGGGMVVTNDESLAKRAKYLTTQAKDDPLEFIHGEVGYNYRLTNIQAAMGYAQMEVLDNYVAKKREIARIYTEAFRGIPGLYPMQEAQYAFSTHWLFTVRVDSRQFGMGSRELLRWLGLRSIQARPLWQPMHMSPAHRLSYAGACPVTASLHDVCLSLPSSVGLTSDDHQRVINSVLEAAPAREMVAAGKRHDA